MNTIEFQMNSLILVKRNKTNPGNIDDLTMLPQSWAGGEENSKQILNSL